MCSTNKMEEQKINLLTFKLLILAVGMTCVPLGAKIDQQFDSEWASNVDEIVANLQQCVQFPGLSLSIVKVNGDKSETFVRNYGVLDIASGRAVDENTRFCIGSVTKGFTAALLTQLLHENGTYHLDSLVKDVLGDEFQLINPQLTTQTTIKDILAHRVGIAKHFGAFLLGYNFTRPQILRRIRYLPQVQPFRSSKVFNNFLYVVAGQMVEKIGTNLGKPNWWEHQLTDKILKPLQMDRTTFADRVADWTSNYALPHALKSGNLTTLRAKVTGNILRPLGPAASMCTTAKDMSKWMKLLLKDANTDSVLHETVIDQLLHIENRFATVKTQDKKRWDSPAEGYTLGWIADKYRNNTRVYHSGFSNYYYTMLSLLPEKGVGIYTSVNGPHLIRCDNGIKAFHFYLMDRMLGFQPWLNSTNICKYPQLSPNIMKTTPTSTAARDAVSTPKNIRRQRRRRLQRSATSTTPNLAKYEGSYMHSFFGPLVISLNRTVDHLQVNYGYYGKAILEKKNEQIFQMKFFSSIWYQSESDDMKLFATRKMFNVQFGNFSNSRGGAPHNVVVFLFDTEAPPVFSRI